MGRKTVEEQESIHQSFLDRLTKKLSAPIWRFSVGLQGEVKRKFIEDLKTGSVSINKKNQEIYKFYYDNR